MKKLFVFAVILLLAGAGVAMAQSSGPLSSTVHNLSISGPSTMVRATTETQICIFCHTPHGGGAVGTATPLWNHNPTVTNLNWNTTTTIRGTPLPTDITGVALEGARACLSCHDGSISIGSVVATGSSGVTPIVMGGTEVDGSGKLMNTSSAYIDTSNMQTNHPVGVPKPSAKTGFSDFVASDGNTGVWYKKSSDTTERVQCQSCHNPHGVGFDDFLRISNDGSAICKSCHSM